MAIMEAMSRHGPLRDGNSRAAVDRFIIVAPQLPESAKGKSSWGRYAGEVRRIVAEVPDRGPHQTFLTGFSFGGNGVLSIAADPTAPDDFWAAVWPVDPTEVAGSPRCRRIWLSMGERSRGFAGQFQSIP